MVIGVRARQRKILKINADPESLTSHFFLTPTPLRHPSPLLRGPHALTSSWTGDGNDTTRSPFCRADDEDTTGGKLEGWANASK